MTGVILFSLSAVLAVIGSLIVVRASDPFHSALALIITFGSLGGVYIVLNSPFVAMAQVIVYAGAVVVLFLFVLAYLGDRREVIGEYDRSRATGVIGGLLGLSFFGTMVWALTDDRVDLGEMPAYAELQDGFGSVELFGEVLVTRYLLHFEVISIVLLTATVGGIVLGLTGRARQTRMRQAIGSYSTDQHRAGLDARDDNGDLSMKEPRS